MKINISSQWIPTIISICSIPFFAKCLASHWCMTGHNAHNQLFNHLEFLNDFIFVSLFWISFILSYFYNISKTWYWHLSRLPIFLFLLYLTVVCFFSYNVFDFNWQNQFRTPKYKNYFVGQFIIKPKNQNSVQVKMKVGLSHDLDSELIFQQNLERIKDIIEKRISQLSLYSLAEDLNNSFLQKDIEKDLTNYFTNIASNSLFIKEVKIFQVQIE